MIGRLGPAGPHPNRVKPGVAPEGRYAAESGVVIIWDRTTLDRADGHLGELDDAVEGTAYLVSNSSLAGNSAALDPVAPIRQAAPLQQAEFSGTVDRASAVIDAQLAVYRLEVGLDSVDAHNVSLGDLLQREQRRQVTKDAQLTAGQRVAPHHSVSGPAGIA
jgi:hypothetical protein